MDVRNFSLDSSLAELLCQIEHAHYKLGIFYLRNDILSLFPWNAKFITWFQYFSFTFPMHCPTHGQWWSKRSTQLLQMEQCEHRGGRKTIQVSQYFTFTGIPFTITSFTRGNCSIPGVSVRDKLSEWISSTGGCEARGTMPGSRAAATKSNRSTYTKNAGKNTKI